MYNLKLITMKKVFLCIIMNLVILSCSSDDENSSLVNTNAISFNLNGVDYYLTEYSVTLDAIDTNQRRIEASFDNNMKTLLFFVLVEETNQIGEFILIENDTHYSSDVNFGNRETSITTHTDSKMEGTFRVTMEDTRNRPLFVFTDGVINIEY